MRDLGLSRRLRIINPVTNPLSGPYYDVLRLFSFSKMDCMYVTQMFPAILMQVKHYSPHFHVFRVLLSLEHANRHTNSSDVLNI